jgi:hypothetical protein
MDQQFAEWTTQPEQRLISGAAQPSGNVHKAKARLCCAALFLAARRFRDVLLPEGCKLKVREPMCFSLVCLTAACSAYRFRDVPLPEGCKLKVKDPLQPVVRCAARVGGD